MPLRAIRSWMLLLALLLVPTVAMATTGQDSDPTPWTSLGLALLLANLAGEVALRLGQPPVLGELLAGIALGNLDLLGLSTFRGLEAAPLFTILAQVGVVLLLFEVGLDSSPARMRQVAPSSGLVAIVGVVLPMLLGAATCRLLLPDAPPLLPLFVGATLSATSVGVTARVLRDLATGTRSALDLPEARIILGAAVLDDVLGLLLLSVVAAIAAGGQVPGGRQLLGIVGLPLLFLLGAGILGRGLLPPLFRAVGRLRQEGVQTTLAIACCLLLAGASAAVGLAPIVGAFVAGLLIDRVPAPESQPQHDLAEGIRPIVAVLAPVFFVRTGMAVDLGGLSLPVLILATSLTVVAIAGKLAAGLGVRGEAGTGPRGPDRLLVGIGMIPRGEVGLIFADVGTRTLVAGQPLVTPPLYLALVLMVLASTVVAPPWLAWRMRRHV